MKFKNYQELQNKKEDYSSFAVPAAAASKTSLPPQTPQLSYNEIPQGMNLSVLQQNLGNCLQIIDDEVMKGYRVHLSDLPIVPLDQDTKLSLRIFNFSVLVNLYIRKTNFPSMHCQPCFTHYRISRVRSF